ncbi:MAG TPA: Gfo/Idh/MocA family oxidoreductase [Candidatus Ratteibacteria bacterium]|jgi:predicted dehydrogenase|nr:Gfo/Idh/MocA family oxidoreductase [bacterium]HPC29839.1 Gfo/Idh/MocA family oxidoreductase [bacterium]HRS05532.1 Gfo/Idh/MocA family oxidoreductase [Candidatus Ratteibacteria bacterium]HRV03611.1 Gfo/Idh/MocA family oxidoreductase [Candidatus Ratteibacteria bacterium]
MKKFNVGIVGLSRGRGFVSLFEVHPDVSVKAVCDIDEDKLSTVGDAFNLPDKARFTKFDDFINADIDIVMIATPIPFHTEQTIKSLEAGKHVLCEQTVAYTVEECQMVVDAVKRTGKKYMMAENYCYFHYIREWKKIVEAGKIGEILYAEGEYIHEIVNLLVDKATGKFYWRHNRPPIWYCAHTLGPLLMLMNDRIVKACGLTTGFRSYPEYKDHPGFLDFEVGLFKTEKGSVVKILRSQVPACPHFVWYCLYGTNGHLENKRVKGEGFIYVKGQTPEDGEVFTSSIVDPNAPPEAKKGGHGTSEYYMIRDFLSSIENNTNPPIDVFRATEWTIPGIIAHKSAMKDGQWLDVPILG